MNYKKRIMSLLIMAQCVLGLSAQTEGVILKLKDGNEVAFMFTSKPKVAMASEVLTIATADGTAVSYEYSLIRSVEFSGGSANAIEEAETSPMSDIVFRVNGGNITVEGLAEGQSVSVYTIGGQMVTSAKQSAGNAALSIEIGKSGIFIVRTSTGVSYKVQLNP